MKDVKKEFKEKLMLILGLILLLILYLSYHVFNVGKLNIGLLRYEWIGLIFMICILIIIYYLSSILFNSTNMENNKYQEKLFTSLIKSSDTIYVVFDSTFNKILYMTKNVGKVLMNQNDDDQEYQINKIKQILNLSIIDTDLRKWNKNTEYLSPVVEYRPNTKWIRIKINPLLSKKNLFYIVTIVDATKEHTSNHMLISQASKIKEREKTLNQIILNTYDTEIDVNLDTGISTFIDLKKANNYDETTSSNYQEELDKLLSTINGDQKEEVKKVLSLDNLKKQKDIINIRYKLNSEDNIWYESTVFIMNNKATILTQNVTEDVENLRKQNITLNNALDDLKKANDYKTDFLKTLSHDIRNPMNVIMGLSTSLLEERLDVNIKDDIESINLASHNILNIIDGLLDIEGLEHGKKSVLEEYIVSTIFKDIYINTLNMIGEKDIKLNFKVSKNIPTILKGDNSKLKQILLNILNNSVKYTDKGYIILIASCERINNQTNLSITIQDTGIGMNKDELINIFNNNEKALTQSRNALEKMNGVMNIDSKEGMGTIVAINLTQDIINDKPVGDIDYSTKEFSFESKKVLIVDDDKLNLKVASKMLNKYGIETNTLLSGKECLEEIKNSSYDLILIDQKMPDMDGTTTLQELRKDDSFNTPVVVLTADAIKGVDKKYKEAGFDDYLAKPINQNKLLEILNKYLGVNS